MRQYYFTKIKTNKISFLLVLILSISLLVWSVVEDKILHMTGYLVAMVVSAFAIDLYIRYKPQQEPTEIKNPKQEIRLIVIIFFLQILVTTCRFIVFPDMNAAHPVIRISLFALMILVIYPVALIIYYFLIKRYKPSALGLKINKGIWMTLLVISVMAMATFLVAPEKMKFQSFFQEYGLVQMLLLGFISAAIPEEFVRYLAQSRLAVAFKNVGLAWFLAGFIWAIIHIPNFYFQSKDFFNAFMGAIEILPLGLLWGYMTLRLKSIWPSVLVHGTNLWGLQNL